MGTVSLVLSFLTAMYLYILYSFKKKRIVCNDDGLIPCLFLGDLL